jgi:hypothetical protein
MPEYRVTIYGKDDEAMLDLVRRHEVFVFHHTMQHLADGGYGVDATLDADQIARLEVTGYRIERHEDVAEEGMQRQAEVAQSDIYQAPWERPDG